MKKRIVFFMLALMAASMHLNAKTALVVIAHGAPSPQWNKPVLDLENRLHSIDIPGICYKRVALMEFSQPNISSVIKDCEKQGIDTIFALPLFIATSSHSEDDIPNILGLKYDPAVRQALAEENAELVKSNIRFVVGPVLMSSDIIEKTMMQRVKEMSKDEKNEGVLILAHGDPDRIGFWNSLLKRTNDFIKQNSKINYVDTELIGMGQNFANDVIPLINKAKKSKKRVLVQGIYLMSSVGEMAKYTGLSKNAGENVVFSNYGILPESSQQVVNWIVETTQNWMKTK
jgi:sirohydrochlorin ferrochelatase